MKTLSEVAFAEFRAAGIEPDENAPWNGVMHPHPCVCMTCGAHVSPRLGHIRSGTGGCRKCGNIRAHEKVRVSSKVAFAEFRAAGIDPDITVPWVNVITPHPGICMVCGDRVYPRLNTIRNGGGACRRCANARGGKIRQVPAEIAFAEFRAARVEPDETVPWKGASVKHPGICMKCGNKVTPQLSIIRMGVGACSNCATYGFKSGEPSIIYLVQHNELQAIKVGVANIGSNRLNDHARNGWKLINKWKTTTGQEALTVERVVLSYWRSSGAPNGAPKEAMPQKGANETAPINFIDLAATMELINITLTTNPGNHSTTA